MLSDERAAGIGCAVGLCLTNRGSILKNYRMCVASPSRWPRSSHFRHTEASCERTVHGPTSPSTAREATDEDVSWRTDSFVEGRPRKSEKSSSSLRRSTLAVLKLLNDLDGILAWRGDACPRLGFPVTCCGTCLRRFIRVRSIFSPSRRPIAHDNGVDVVPDGLVRIELHACTAVWQPRQHESWESEVVYQNWRKAREGL